MTGHIDSQGIGERELLGTKTQGSAQILVELPQRSLLLPSRKFSLLWCQLPTSQLSSVQLSACSELPAAFPVKEESKQSLAISYLSFRMEDKGKKIRLTTEDTRVYRKQLEHVT